jgi:hypothetical protein
MCFEREIHTLSYAKSIFEMLGTCKHIKDDTKFEQLKKKVG